MDQQEQDRLLAEALLWEECNSATVDDDDGPGPSVQPTQLRRFETSIYDLDEDRKLAEKLQREEENEYLALKNETPERRDPQHVAEFRALIERNKGLSLVDRQWEIMDPTPDVHAMFQVFDDMFFGSALRFCTVSWSPRMTTCAGLCCYQKGQCSIRLSKPLLTLRPRSDLVETLLHEMIHAYIMLSGKSRGEGRDGHGPEFHRNMYRINKEAKCNITVYHTFHDEVRHYKVHHWRCNGPCQNQRPFFGWVKRSMNRAPSKNDTWWADHQRKCGGTFIKVAGPEMQKAGNSAKNLKRPAGQPAGGNTSPLSKKLKKATSGSSGSPSKSITGLPKGFVPFQGSGNKLGSSASSTPSHSLATKIRPSASARSPVKGSTSTTPPLRQTTLDRLFGKKKSPVASTSAGFPSRKVTTSSASDALCKKLIVELFSSDEEQDDKTSIQKATSTKSAGNPSGSAAARSSVEVSCPVCSTKVPEQEINAHLDVCLGQ